MTQHTDPPWEPPLAGSDVQHVTSTLERLRATFRWKADGLDVDQLRARAIPTTELTATAASAKTRRATGR